MVRVKRQEERKATASRKKRKNKLRDGHSGVRKVTSRRSAFYKYLRVCRVQRKSCGPLLPLGPFRRQVRYSLSSQHWDTRYTLAALKLQRLLVESTVHEILKEAAWATTFVADRAVMPKWILAMCFRRWAGRNDVNCHTGSAIGDPLYQTIESILTEYTKNKDRDDLYRMAMIPL